jgi:hypothetical protein
MRFKYLDADVPLPRLIRVRQRLEAPRVEAVEQALRRELERVGTEGLVAPGERIAIAVGSRGMASLPVLVATVIEQVRAWGGRPSLVPAMGSHGGGTAEGQMALLASLGITPEKIGAPVDPSMEVEEIGRDGDGHPVYFSRAALSADGIIVLNRVKVHTDYHGEFESGVIKMLVIGLGKRRGAETIHKRGIRGLREGIPAAARVILARAPVRLAIATLENAYEDVAYVRAILPRDLFEEEKRLLAECRTLLPRLPFACADVLVVDEVGKEISGTGMDPNVIGRLMITGEKEFERPFIRRIVVLDLTEASHGNCTGLGLADFITERVYRKIDLTAFYVNTLTGAMVERGKIPMIMPTDEEAIKAAARTSWDVAPGREKIARIRNTLMIHELEVSETLLPDILSAGGSGGDIEVVGDWHDFHFDADGRLLPIG